MAKKTCDPRYQQALLFDEGPQGKVLQVSVAEQLSKTAGHNLKCVPLMVHPVPGALICIGCLFSQASKVLLPLADS